MTPKGIAQRYALALFHTMKKKDEMEKALEDYRALLSFLEENPEIKLFLCRFPVKEALKKEIVNKLSSDFSPELSRFFLLLVEKHRLNLMEHIYQYFLQMVNEDQGRVIAHISTPLPLEQDQAEEIVTILQDISGKEVQLEKKINDEIKGGFVIRLGEKLFDASVTTQLDRLYRELTA